MSGTTGAIRAGRAFVELFADDSRLKRGLKAAHLKLKAFGESIGALGTKFLAIGGAMAVPGVLGLKAFAEFETALSNIATLLDEPAKHMERFRRGIQGMAMQYGEGTDTLAKGLYDLISASVAPSKALGVLDVSMRAAKAGVTDVATSTQALINVMNAFHIPAERIIDVSDMMFLTVKRGVTTFPELAEGIGNVTATANAAGLSLDELGASLATMTRNGLKTDIAVTGLQNILLEFLKPSEEGAALAKKYGFELNSMTLKTIGLTGVMQKLAKINPEDIARIFPDARGLRGVYALRGDIEGLTHDVALMAGKSGATDKAFSNFVGNLSGYFKKIKQSVVVVLQEIGAALADSVKQVGEFMKKVAKHTLEWVRANKALIVTVMKVALSIIAIGLALKLISWAILAVAGTLKVLVVAVTILKVALTALMGVFAILKAVITAALTPAGLVITALLAITVAVLYFTGVLAKVWQWLVDRFNQVKNEAVASFDAIGKALAQGNIPLAAKILWLLLKLEWAKGIGALERAWLNFRNFFLKIGYDAWYGLLAIAEYVWHALEVAWIEVSSALLKAAQWSWHGIQVAWIETTAFLSEAWTWFTKSLLQAWNWCANKLEKAWNKIKGIFDSSFDADAANKAADQAYQEGQKRIEQEKLDAIAAREQVATEARRQADAEHKDRMSQLEQERQAKRDMAAKIHEETLYQIGKEDADKHAALDKEYNDRIKASEDEVAKARAEWQAAIDEANKPAPQKGAPDVPGVDDIEGKLKNLLGDLDDLAAGAKGAVRGTFNAMALQGLQGSSAAEKTAENTRQTAENTEEIAQRVRDLASAGGPAFA